MTSGIHASIELYLKYVHLIYVLDIYICSLPLHHFTEQNASFDAIALYTIYKVNDVNKLIQIMAKWKKERRSKLLNGWLSFFGNTPYNQSSNDDSMIERHWNSAVAEFSCEKNACWKKWEHTKENEMKHRFAVICLFVIYKLTAELKTLANFLDYSTTKWFKSV